MYIPLFRLTNRLKTLLPGDTHQGVSLVPIPALRSPSIDHRSVRHPGKSTRHGRSFCLAPIVLRRRHLKSRSCVLIREFLPIATIRSTCFHPKTA